MAQQPQPDNPYSSPGSNPPAVPAAGAVWEDNRVTIEFERTLEDYAIAEWFRMQNRPLGARGWLRQVVLVGLGAIVLLLILTLLQGTFRAGILVAAALYLVLITLALSKRWRFRYVRRVLNQITTADSQEYLIPVRVTFTQEGFDASSQWERRLRRWSAVGRLIELGDYYLFVHGGVVTLVLPKRVFAGPEEMQRFLDWVRTYLPVAAN